MYVQFSLNRNQFGFLKTHNRIFHFSAISRSRIDYMSRTGSRRTWTGRNTLELQLDRFICIMEEIRGFKSVSDVLCSGERSKTSLQLQFQLNVEQTETDK